MAAVTRQSITEARLGDLPGSSPPGRAVDGYPMLRPLHFFTRPPCGYLNEFHGFTLLGPERVSFPPTALSLLPLSTIMQRAREPFFFPPQSAAPACATLAFLLYDDAFCAQRAPPRSARL